MKNEQMRQRTKQFALRIIRMYGQLPKRGEAEVLGKQVLRWARASRQTTARRAGRGRTRSWSRNSASSSRNFDETMLWLELLVESGIVQAERMNDLLAEADELIRMTVAAIKTTKARA